MVFLQRNSLRKSLRISPKNATKKTVQNNSISLIDLNNMSLVNTMTTKKNAEKLERNSLTTSSWRVSKKCLKKFKSIKKITMRKLQRTTSSFQSPILSSKQSRASASSSSIIIWEECYYETIKRKQLNFQDFNV